MSMIFSTLNIPIFLISSAVLFSVDIKDRRILLLVILSTFLPSLLFNLMDTISLFNSDELIYVIRSITFNMRIIFIFSIFSSLVLIFSSLMMMFIMLYLILTENDRKRFIPYLLLTCLGLTVISLTGDVFNLYVFFELFCINCYVLIALSGMRKSLVTAYNYLIIGSLGTSFVLIGVFLYMSKTGSLLIHPLNVPKIALAFLLTGFGIKAAYVPLQWWKPDIISSIHPSLAAFFSGIVTVTGLYCIVKVLPIFFMSTVLMSLALITMIFSSLFALVETKASRILAYGSICQVGYILLGFGLGTLQSVMGSVFHMMNFLISTTTLFLILDATTRFKPNRIVEICFLINVLSLVGIPPLAGFFSKLQLYIASVNVNHPEITFIALFTSTLTFVYYIKTYTTIFSPLLSKNLEKITSPTLLIIILLTSFIFIFSLFPNLLIELSKTVAKNMVRINV